MTTDDIYNLHRFVEAQSKIYANALEELNLGKKRTHWMWFIFPQIAGLGKTAPSRHFAIRNIDEAKAYLAHQLLGYRLIECTRTVLSVKNRTISEIFGWPDDLKFRSCMTLFGAVSEPDSVFQQALDVFYEGVADQQTLSILSTQRDIQATPIPYDYVDLPKALYACLSNETMSSAQQEILNELGQRLESLLKPWQQADIDAWLKEKSALMKSPCVFDNPHIHDI